MGEYSSLARNIGSPSSSSQSELAIISSRRPCVPSSKRSSLKTSQCHWINSTIGSPLSKVSATTYMERRLWNGSASSPTSRRGTSSDSQKSHPPLIVAAWRTRSLSHGCAKHSGQHRIAIFSFPLVPAPLNSSADRHSEREFKGLPGSSNT